MIRLVAKVALVLPLLAGCARQSAVDLPGPSFPADAELEQLAARPVAPPANSPAGPSVELWVLAQPLPSAAGVGPALGDSPGEQLLLEATAADSTLRADESLTCAAHQLAEFFAQKGAAPTRALLRFMVHRCGVTMPAFGWAATTSPTPPQLADLRALIDQYGLRGELGFWVGQRDDQWLLVAFAGDDRVELDPVEMVVTGGQLMVSGRLSGPRDWIMGHVSQGELGVGECQNLGEVGDRFRLVCPVQASDAGAFVDVYAAAPGRVLGDLEARVWVSPNGSLSASYEDPARGHEAAPISGPLDQAFVAAVNEARAKAGAGPLSVVAAQSEASTALRPHFRAARASGDGAIIDQIVLGLLAGWEVEEPILAGHFSELEFENVTDRRHLIDAALAQPGMRAALLDPKASRIALTIDPGGANEVLGGMFTTYTLATPGERVDERRWLNQLITLARKSRSLPPPTALRGAEQALADAARQLAAGKLGLQATVDAALAEIAEQNPGREIAGQLLFMQDVREFELPKELMAPGAIAVAVHVELVQPASSPWATLAVLLVYSPG